MPEKNKIKVTNIEWPNFYWLTKLTKQGKDVMFNTMYLHFVCIHKDLTFF